MKRERLAYEAAWVLALFVVMYSLKSLWVGMLIVAVGLFALGYLERLSAIESRLTRILEIISEETRKSK